MVMYSCVRQSYYYNQLLLVDQSNYSYGEVVVAWEGCFASLDGGSGYHSSLGTPPPTSGCGVGVES